MYSLEQSLATKVQWLQSVYCGNMFIDKSQVAVWALNAYPQHSSSFMHSVEHVAGVEFLKLLYVAEDSKFDPIS